MISKRIFLFFCTFVSFFLFLMNIGFAQNQWEEGTVKEVTKNNFIRLYDENLFRLMGIDLPQGIFDERQNYKCIARKTHRLLRLLLEHKNIKIKKHSLDLPEYGVFPQQVKIESSLDLAEFLLEEGYGSFVPEVENKTLFRRYEMAEKIARDEQLGIWSHCGKNQDKSINLRNWWGDQFRKKYGQFLAPVSVGRVKEVFSGQSLVLDNGLKVRLLGIEVPSPQDQRPAFACFGKYSKAYLESLVLDKQIFLERDVSEFDEQRHLWRYITIPSSRNQKEIFVNQKMIEDGFARNFWLSEKDVEFRKDFEQIQEQVWQDPKGAWLYCLDEILEKEDGKEKELILDQTCPIKGNISGSKSNPTKTYHTPASRWYKNLKQEVCFNTEKEAEDAGFRKVK